MSRTLSTVVLLSLASACAPNQNPSSTDQCPDVNYNLTEVKDASLVGMPGPIETVIENEMASRNFPGCGVAIASRGEVLYAKGYGASDIGANPNSTADDTPWDQTTVSVIGSVSKVLTATALVRLEEMGEINLDDDLASQFPHAVPAGWGSVSVRDVLQHRAGFVRDLDPNEPGFIDAAGIDATWGIANASQHPRYGMWQFLFADAGTPDPAWMDRYRYSNVGYEVLGAVIDQITTTPGFSGEHRGYEAFVWGVVNDTNSGSLTSCLNHDWRGNDIPNLATSYAGDGVTVSDFPYDGVEGPAGGWSMTVADLARFMANLEAHRLVDSGGLTEMRDVPATWVGSEPRYGLGLFLDPVNSMVTYGHGGSIEGYRTQVYTWPTEELSVAVMCNADASGVGSIASKVGQTFLDIAGTRQLLEFSDEERRRTHTAAYEVSREHADDVMFLAGRYRDAFGQRRGARRMGLDVWRQSPLAQSIIRYGRAGETEVASAYFLRTLYAEGRVGTYVP